MFPLNKLRQLSAVSVIGLLAACGGGGDDGDGGSVITPPTPVQQSLPTVVGGSARLLAGSLWGECGNVNNYGAITLHAGDLWMADRSCQGDSAQVRVFDVESGAVRTYASAVLSSAATAPRATGFRYPTGIVFDSQNHLFVLDGGNAASKYVSGFSTILRPDAGHASGIWKIDDQGMSVFAGVILNETVDGAGESAGFTLANGLVKDASDHLYTSDHFTTVRKITPQAEVTSLSATGCLFPAANYTGSRTYLIQRQGEISELTDMESGAKVASFPSVVDMVRFDSQDRIYAARYSASGGTTPADPVVIYRGNADGTSFEPVVTNVEYLSDMAVDDGGNLYLHQRNAIVKVEFSQ